MEVIRPFILGAIDALQVQGGLKLSNAKPFLKGQGEIAPIAVVAQLGLASARFKGAVSLCFEEKVFLQMLSNMFGEEVTEITAENQDGAAEVLNMMYGAAKRVLNEQGYDFEKAIPTVVRGAALQTSLGKSPTPIVIPLKSPVGFVYIEVAYS